MKRPQMSQTILRAIREWAASDAAPGRMIWQEVEGYYGLSREHCRALAPDESAIVEAVVAEIPCLLCDDEDTYFRVWAIADRLWMHNICQHAGRE